ncbi:MAG: Glucose-6-phosphate isomerase [Candidatus Anoxychlamydiales bacterium]|nr:Glucose-6-phosphate isomerase [Candidatus Anoxychlamydiales bacterium]
MSKFISYKSYLKLKELANNPIDLTDESIYTKKRIEDFKIENMNIKYLYSSQRVNEDVINQLNSLAKDSDAIDKMKDMQNGKIVNYIENFKSEERAVLHTALRDIFENRNEETEAKKASDLAYLEIQKLEKFINENDDKFENIIQIGIGGSFLGPKALVHAMSAYQKEDKNIYFISNVDPDEALNILSKVDLTKSLFITVSKSGTTIETLTNEEFVKNALIKKGLNPKDHMIAVTAKDSKMDDKSKYLESFYIWDYIGGRYSATSMVGGVVLSFAIGFDKYIEILKGANSMDKIALDTNIEKNLPLFSALIGIWNRNFLNYNSISVIPYSHFLLYFPTHLQQLDMESNGKSITKDGKEVDFKTGPLVFGDIGTNAQHSYFQLLHQGTDIVPIEFIGFKNSIYNIDEMVDNTTSQEKLLSNLFAQSIALAKGKKDENLNKNFLGNRVNSILLLDKLTPYTIGAILAYYEHKIAFQGFLWDINSFDQEGVQLGKKLSNQILDIYKSKDKSSFDLGSAYLNQLK